MAAISPLTLIFQAVDQASPVVRNLIGDLKKNFEIVTSLSFAYNEVAQTIQQFAAQGQRAYSLLIGQNVELQQQLLSTQATLVATNKVISQGVEVTDPGKAIQALTDPVNQAVARLRKGSLELVGVTSNELIPLFQITAQSSASIGASLDQSADLALSFGSALGTLGIPLQQARQELLSIYTAQVTSDSQLAKSIGLNNEQINQYKSQGILVQKLTEKLAAFRAGNAIQAQTISGITSNIQDVIDELGRVTGAPLLQPIVTQLNVLYNFLIQNKDAIQDIATSVINFFLQIGTKLGEAIAALQPVLKTLSEALFNQLSAEASAAASIITILVNAFVNLVQASAPLLQVLANITLFFAQLSNSPIGQIVIEAGALLAIASTLLPVISALFVTVTSLISGAILLSGSIATLTAGFTSFIAAAGGVSGILATIASGGFPALAAAALGAVPALGTFAAAATAAVAPLLPIIALGGAVVLALEIKQTGDLRVANEELEEFRQQNDLLGDQSIELATKLKTLNDAERANGKLTEEETKRRKGLQQITKEQTEALQSQIAAIKQVQPANEEQKRTQEAQVVELQKQIDLLSKLSGGVKLTAKDVQILGNDYQQLAKKIGDAQTQFNSGGGGDNSRFQSAAKDVVKLTQEQVELGQITEAQAVEQLNKVRNNVSVELDVRRSAQQEIEKIQQGGVEKRTKTLENEQQKIQVAIANETTSQAEGQRQITENKLKQLDIQLKATEKAIADENVLRKSQVDAQVAAIDIQVNEAQKRLADAQGKGDKGGVRIANEDIAKLEGQRTAAQESLKIDNDRITQLKGQQQKFSTEIAQTQGQERTRVRQERLKDFDEQQQILDAQNAQRLITQEQFNQQSLAIARNKATAELAQLEEQRGKTTDKEGLEAIAAKEATIRQKLADATEKFEGEKSKARIAVVDTEQKELSAKLAEGGVTQQEYNQRSLTLTQQRLAAELDEVQRQRKRLRAGDTQRLNELDAQEADIRKRGVDATEKFEGEKSKARIAVVDTEQKELSAKLAEGAVSQQQYNEQSLGLTRQRLTAELDEVQRQRGRLKAGDTQRLNELDAQEADIRKRRLDAIAQNQEQQVALIEQAQKRATDVVSQSESDRLVEITRLEASQTIEKVDAEKLRLDTTSRRIKQELALEKDKLAELEALPPFSDPTKEENRQGQIRASRLKTSGLTKSIIDNEIQQREALYRIVEDRLNKEIQQIQNNATAQNQALEKEKQLQDFLTKTIENQVKLLQARKDVVSSVAGFYEGELNVLKETTKNQKEQKQIAESAALIALNAAREEFKIQQEITKEKLEQKQIELDLKELELRGEQAGAKADTLKAQAEQKKVEARPGATQGEKEAAALTVQAAQAKESGLQIKGVLLGQERAIASTEGQQELDKLSRDAQLQDDQNRLKLAQSRVSKSEGRRETQQLGNEIKGQVGDPRTLGDRVNFAGVGTDVLPLLAQLEAQIKQQLPAFVPQTTQGAVASAVIPTQQSAKVGEALQALANQKPVGTVIINVTNEFSGQDATNGKAADVFTQNIRKELFDLGTLLTR
ncbi:hypothetical protein [Nostoc sp.]|uniref:hypothetical protein n=1 Tax=Nostoc sp. TaxID=1180 RepID=UPI002FF52C7C